VKFLFGLFKTGDVTIIVMYTEVVFQHFLCSWTCLKQDTFWMANDHQEACQDAIASIRIMMRQLQSLWPRETGLE
jgi:hypothetical protein